jgi:two-component system, NtrC family, sensor kinase
MPQLQAIVLLGSDGRPLASSTLEQVHTNVDFSDRDYFRVQRERDAGTYVSEVRKPQLLGVGSDFFDLSRRLASPDGSFRGVIAVAIRPHYFADFYSLIQQTAGGFYALIRSDGALLARYPARTNTSNPQTTLVAPNSLRMAMASETERGEMSVTSAIDGVPRRIGFRRLDGYDVYAVTGTSRAAIDGEWFAMMEDHLVFGLPATLLLFAVLWFALRRTKRLHEEAERREAAEGALRQAQRLEAIGQLTGGVAHDFNNLLMIVSGTVQRLRRHITDEAQTQLLDTISNAMQRGESLTRQLLAFSRRQMLQPSAIDLAERLPEIKDMLSRSLRGDIEIRVNVPRRPCLVKVDPGELELALLNLAVNARDAMPSGGTLTITAKPVVLRGEATEEGLKGEFIAIRIADTGSGIPADILPRVFEPFFTTKDVGKGTGLGLSQVYGFAKQSGGAVNITTSARRGTAVTLFLPRTWETPAPPRETGAAAHMVPSTGKVLLVEDNAEVAAVGKAYLEQLGYDVRRAASAQEGLDAMEGEDRVDLVFSDILMPGGMNGLDFADVVRKRFPGVAVLLTTGYSSSVQDARQRGFEVLQKPYDLVALERALLAAYKSAERGVLAAQGLIS